jgi:transposase
LIIRSRHHSGSAKRLPMSNLFWLTEAPKARIRPFFPKSHSNPRVDNQRVLSAIIFINLKGLRWRNAAKEYERRPEIRRYDPTKVSRVPIPRGNHRHHQLLQSVCISCQYNRPVQGAMLHKKTPQISLRGFTCDSLFREVIKLMEYLSV